MRWRILQFILMIMAVLVPIAPVHALVLRGTSNSLEDLILLHTLFIKPGSNAGIFSSDGSINLGDLFVLDRLFSPEATSAQSNNSEGKVRLGTLLMLKTIMENTGISSSRSEKITSAPVETSDEKVLDPNNLSTLFGGRETFGEATSTSAIESYQGPRLFRAQIGLDAVTPVVITVQAGDEVEWVNAINKPLVFDAFSGAVVRLYPGDTYSYHFTQKGIFPYQLKSGQEGIVVVR